MDRPVDDASALAPDHGLDPSRQLPDLTKIEALLREKDDTHRFAGLALLKPALDNSQSLRQDHEALEQLWAALSSSFLDRLLRTGSKASGDNAQAMLDLAVSVLHAFAVLLPEAARAETKFTGRIPGLVAALVYCSDDTTRLLLQLLHTLVNSSAGAKALVQVSDLSPLSEVAPTHSAAMDVLCYAWLNSMTTDGDKRMLSSRIDDTMKALTSSFAGTDAVTLLEFLASFLRRADPTLLSASPAWLVTVTSYTRKLATSRPTPQARSAYTNAAASLLQTYPNSAPKLLFSDDGNRDRPFGYLLVNLLLIDIRSSVPMLLEQLNSPEYPSISRRLASAFDVISFFVGYLVRSLEDDAIETLIMLPDNLLKLRKAISETMSLTVEHLRDRWDASVAGAMGLHPDARTGTAETSSGSHRTLAWDSMANAADDDPFVLSAIRALALWLREDENEMLRKEATGLIDVFLDLYRASSAEKLDFRPPILLALEAMVTLSQGRELLLRQDGWQILSKDLCSTMQDDLGIARASEEARGFDVVRVLLQVAEEESGGTVEEWMNLITATAAWDTSGRMTTLEAQEFQLAMLQLCCALLTGASMGMRNRFQHSIAALDDMAVELSSRVGHDSPLREMMDDVTSTLGGMREA